MRQYCALNPLNVSVDVMNRKKIGNKGEELAVSFLSANGYEVLHRNYWAGRAEVDIIARHESSLIFIEVKTRKSIDFGYPEEFVSEAQQERIHYAAEEYIINKDWKGDIRFDILAIVWDGSKEPNIEHFEDAF